MREAVVVGVPDPEWGETPAAYVHVNELSDSTAPQLEKWLRSRLAGFKRPRHMFLSRDPIPRASGESKIARGDIKRLIRSWVAEPTSTPDNVKKAGKNGG